MYIPPVFARYNATKMIPTMFPRRSRAVADEIQVTAGVRHLPLPADEFTSRGGSPDSGTHWVIDARRSAQAGDHLGPGGKP